jgi:molybdate transport system permease protein
VSLTAQAAPPRAMHGRAPLALTIPALIALLFLIFPVVAIFVRAPWGTLGQDLSTPEARDALRLSLETTLVSTAACVVLGVPLAWVLARTAFRGRSLVRALVTLPLVLPPVVGGIALLLALGRNGIVGKPLYDAFGITFPFTTEGVILAQTFVALPFMVISVEGAFRASDPRYDEAAATLGASRWSTFRRVTLPLALPGIVAGSLLVFIPLTGEYLIPAILGGNKTAYTGTLIAQQFSEAHDWPLGSAVAMVVIAGMTIVLVAFSRIAARGEVGHG